MPGGAPSDPKALSRAIESISKEWTRRQRLAHRLLASDALERLVPSKLLLETLGAALEARTVPEQTSILVMDRAGGADGAKTTAGLLPLVSAKRPGARVVHAAFTTPRGVGILIKGVLSQAAAACGVVAEAIGGDGPVEGLCLSAEDEERLVAGFDLVVTFAPSGAAGLVSREPCGRGDPLLARSHVAVLSYPDPEGLVADLDRLGEAIETEPGLDAVRFWVEVEDRGAFEALGYATLGEGGDARERLWVLLDNARRRPYRVLVEPMHGGLPAGDPLVCPCRAVIEARLAPDARVVRVVPAGRLLVAVAEGLRAS
ncbi:MAG: hypothetical protein PHU25_19430 [Deltaproteobacteria bacterium]|nr:hypothetical protein [Deltaproteobacteria bacterium]